MLGNPLRLRGTVLFVSSVPFVIVLTLISFFIPFGSDLSQAQTWVTRTLSVEKKLYGLQNDLLTAESSIRAFALTKSSIQLNTYQSALTSLNEDYQTLQRLVADDPAQVASVDKLAEAVRQRGQMLEEVRIRTQSGELDTLALVEKGRLAMSRVQAIVSGMLQKEERLLHEREAWARKSKSHLVLLSWAALLLMVLWTAWIPIYLYRRLVSRTESLAEAVRACRPGEILLTRSQNADEIGILGNALADATERFANVQADLAMSKTRLATALDSAGMVAWTRDLTQDFVEFDSERESRLNSMGLAPQVSNSIYKALIHPDDIERVRCAWSMFTKGESANYRLEYRLLQPTGEWKWVESTSKIVERFADGSPRRLTGILLDITEHKRQIAEIGDLRSKLQAILDSASGVAIIATDLNGTVTLFSKGAEQMLGYTSQEVTGQLSGEALHGMEKLTPVSQVRKEKSALGLRALLDIAAEKLEPGHKTEQRWMLRRKDGQQIIVDLTLNYICDQDGNALGRVCIVKDVTRQAEAEERFRAFMAVSPAATYIKDQQGYYIYANEITEKAVGKNLSELVKLSDRDLFPEDVAEKLQENDRQALASPAPITGIVESFPSADGRVGHWQSYKFAFQTPMGQKYLGGVSVDVTGQKELERRLREANEHLEIQRAVAEKALQDKSNFLACMSHEIRTPMNGVLGLLDVLLRLPDLTTYQRMLLEKIHDSSETLLLIINDILDISKIESGKMQLEAVEFTLEEVVRSATDLLRAQAENKGIRLDLQTAILPVRRVQGDAIRLRQILTNLLSNAIKFTQHGAVCVSVRLKERTGHQAVFQFEVQDSGIGMTKEFQQRMFDQFSQADLSTAREYGGTGLGLAIVKKLIDLMGGSIHVESEPGRGTTFTFTLKLALATVPRCSETPHAEDAEPAERDTALSSWRVLVAEDNPINQLLARLVLEQAGLNVDIVSNGIEAVSAAQASRYDVILMDCRMPQLNGCQATEQIRQSPGPSQNSPVIALSASAFAEDIALCHRSGMNDFVAKPFKPEVLLQKCCEWASQDVAALPQESSPAEPETSEQAAPLCIPEQFSPSLVDELIRLFLKEYPGKFAELLDALRKNDREGARDAAHWLRGGACRTLMPTLSRHFEEIENASRNPRHSGPIGDAELLLALFRTVQNAAEVWVDTHN